MQKIIKSLGLLAGAVAVIGAGATGAFFSDTETSSGNTFTAGAIDLKIDNESYYNGAVSEGTSWSAQDLGPACETVADTLTCLFFNFLDIKPDDWGEDTISIHVDTNDAYLCADVTLTSNDDNGINEPEGLAGDITDGAGQGELAANVEFLWWADDGDNVLEQDESVISEGPIGALTLDVPFAIALADSDENIWQAPGPIDGNTDYFIGKAWCFGNIGGTQLPQANYSGPNDPANAPDAGLVTPEDGGISCDGTLLTNITQTDSLTADITFEATQARNNPGFQCEEGGPCEFNETVDLLIDGRFETPEVTNGAQWDVFDSPAGGWNVDWRGDIPANFGPQVRPTPAKLELHEGVLGAAFEGDQYAELDTDWGGPTDGGNGEPASVTIYRNFVTIPGANYSLKYHFSPRPNTAAADNNLEVKVEGVALDTTGPTAGGGAIAWSERTVNFIAGDASTEIRFTDLGTANSLGTFLDNVRLYQTSCPLN